MATESPLIHDGSQCVAAADYRNSAITGTTLPGPSGSGQFLAVIVGSTSRTVALASTGSLIGVPIYGILQNKPSSGSAADVGIFGPSKMVAGGTITAGNLLMASSTANGTIVAYSTSLGFKIGIAIESAVVGQVFTGTLFGGGIGSTA